MLRSRSFLAFRGSTSSSASTTLGVIALDADLSIRLGGATGTGKVLAAIAMQAGKKMAETAG